MTWRHVSVDEFRSIDMISIDILCNFALPRLRLMRSEEGQTCRVISHIRIGENERCVNRSLDTFQIIE